MPAAFRRGAGFQPVVQGRGLRHRAPKEQRQQALYSADELTLTGRLKEMISFGGEKVAPAEIDEALMDHPAVRQALAFGVPCPARGERVYAAVVLDVEVGERELQGFLRDRLTRFMVPERIIIVEEIPKGPTGKMQRVGMAARLGLG